MTSRFRLVLVAAPLALAGCGGVFNAGPTTYAESEQLTKTLKEKPKLQDAVRKALADLFGDNPTLIKVPRNTGLPYGGRRLGGRFQEGKGDSAKSHALQVTRLDTETGTTVLDPKTGKPVVVAGAGGYTLYRRHCLHCHGVTGDGAGPTADFLFPRPRDYRKGIFKFTSTATGAKPTRSDLLKTIKYGLAGTSMPAFESMMTPEEIEQVTDYMIFLSMRGETELALIDFAESADESSPDPLPAEEVQGVAEVVFNKWKTAESQVLNPPVKRTPPSRESIVQGRTMFLGRTKEKLECWGCHGANGRGNGPSFIDQRIFDLVVFSKEPLERAIIEVYKQDSERAHALAEHGHSEGGHHEAAAPPEDLKRFVQKNEELWKASIDDWGQPLRPADLNKGIYKGGRRPIDLYWRIAKGINGAKMPGHVSALKPEQIWDLVNFVLAVPYDVELLRDATPPAGVRPPVVAQQSGTRGGGTPLATP